MYSDQDIFLGKSMRVLIFDVFLNGLCYIMDKQSSAVFQVLRHASFEGSHIELRRLEYIK